MLWTSDEFTKLAQGASFMQNMQKLPDMLGLL